MGRDNPVAVMQIYHFTCNGCGYESKLPLGSSDLDQVLTDANADYADYHLFRCDKSSTSCTPIFIAVILKVNVLLMEANWKK